jgi:hypothetical protein
VVALESGGVRGTAFVKWLTDKGQARERLKGWTAKGGFLSLNENVLYPNRAMDDLARKLHGDVAFDLSDRLTAAVRVFDLVLVGAPGSIQSEVDVVGLFWWRHRDDLGDGQASALAVLLSAMAVALAMLVLWRLRRDLPEMGQGRESRHAPPPGRPRWTVQVMSAATALTWAFPFVTLLLTSFRSPDEAATSGWWTGGYGLGSYGEAFENSSFAGALGATAQRGLLVSVVVLLVAVPAAYALTPEQLSRRARRIVAAGTPSGRASDGSTWPCCRSAGGRSAASRVGRTRRTACTPMPWALWSRPSGSPSRRTTCTPRPTAGSSSRSSTGTWAELTTPRRTGRSRSSSTNAQETRWVRPAARCTRRRRFRSHATVRPPGFVLLAQNAMGTSADLWVW